MGVRRTGDWGKARAKLAAAPGARLTLALKRATLKNTVLLVREIKRGIRSQAPGGKPFAKLVESTIRRKGSTKALIDTGFLVNAITQKILAEGAFVGLVRGTLNKEGDDLVNIGGGDGVRRHHPTLQRRHHHHSAATVFASGDGQAPQADRRALPGGHPCDALNLVPTLSGALR